MNKKQKILIVDDVKTIRLLLVKMLKSLDVEFFEAGDGNEAVSLAEHNSFDLILMDVLMPGMNGFEAVELIRKEEKNKFIPIIYQTAVANDEQSIIKGIESGAVDYITKPISGEILIGKVKRFLEIQKNRKELIKLNKQLKENTKNKNLFLAAMSHEIRTPMNSILGSTHLLGKANPRKDQKQFIDIIETSGRLLLGIVNNVLDYSKLEAGNSVVLKNCFSLKKITDELSSILTSLAKEKELEFIIQVETDLSTKIIGDDIRLEQILINLCNNAIKYTNKGSVILKIVKKSESENIIKYRFSVVDTGIGILKENIKHLFKPFSQFSLLENKDIESTGLGLSIVKNTLELIGGKLKVKSVYGIGSTFWFDLTFNKLLSEDKRKKSLKSRNEYSKIKEKLKILIVDDDKFSRIILEKILTDEGCKSIESAKNGQEALSLAAANEYDVILMDCMMPVMNGFDSTAAIRKAEKGNKRTYIIALSADALDESRKKCLNIGMDNFLLKPVNPKLLDDSIRKIILSTQRHQATEKK